MQIVFAGESDRSMHLMRDRGREWHGEIGAQPRSCESEAVAMEAVLGGDGPECLTSRTGHGCRFASKLGDLVLDRLEFSDGLAELLARGRVLDAVSQHRLD